MKSPETESINLKYKFGHIRNITRLLKAINERNYREIETLIYNGIPVNQQTKEYGLPVCQAIRQGLSNEIINLITVNGADLNLQGYDGCFPLPLAIKYDLEYVALLFLENGANPNVIPDSHRVLCYPAVHTAVAKHNIPLLKILHHYGADLNIRDACFGTTPLTWAARAGYTDMVEVLLMLGARVNEKDRNGSTTLHYAEKYGNEEIIRILTCNGAEYSVTPDESINDLLINAVEREDIMLAGKLLLKGASPEAVKFSGLTLLLIAIQQFNNDIIHLLLENGADVTRKDNNESCTPLEKYLSTLNRIIKNKNIDLARPKEIVHLFLEKGAITEESGLVSGILNEAVNSPSDIFREILNNTKNVDFRTRSGITALMEASANGNFENAKLLISYNAGINAKCYSNGMTALMYAASADNNNIVSLLVEQGADVYLSDFSGKTALSYAVNGPVSLNENALLPSLNKNKPEIMNLLFREFIHLNEKCLSVTPSYKRGIYHEKIKLNQSSFNLLIINENVYVVKYVLTRVLMNVNDKVNDNKSKEYYTVSNCKEILDFMKYLALHADINQAEYNSIVRITSSSTENTTFKVNFKSGFILLPYTGNITVMLAKPEEKNTTILNIVNSVFLNISGLSCLVNRPEESDKNSISSAKGILEQTQIKKSIIALENWISLHCN